ncbi:MAG TPA: YqiA/YcfP family alpha/beta fold hydrolase, partial [Ottowia sp.]|nr:YqiA/YcfP family alpha/beta fold hydrolase [Ottowia sp.]
WLAGRRGCKLVVLNPAVDPVRDLAAHIGEQSAWHDPAERFFFSADHVQELRALRTGPLPAPERCLAVIAQGDELLDWREMAARYAGARQIVLAGGDHALSDFEAHVDAVLDFLDLS